MCSSQSYSPLPKLVTGGDPNPRLSTFIADYYANQVTLRCGYVSVREGWTWKLKYMTLGGEYLKLQASASSNKTRTEIPLSSITKIERSLVKPYALKVLYFHSAFTSTQTLYLAFSSEDDVYGWMDALNKSSPTSCSEPYALEHPVSVKVTEQGFSGLPPHWEAAHSGLRSPSTPSSQQTIAVSPFPMKRPTTQDSAITLVSQPSIASLRSVAQTPQPSPLQKSSPLSRPDVITSSRPTETPERNITTTSSRLAYSVSNSAVSRSRTPSAPPTPPSKSASTTPSPERQATKTPTPTSAPTRTMPAPPRIERSYTEPSAPLPPIPHPARIQPSRSDSDPTSIYFIPDDNDGIQYLPNPYGTDTGHGQDDDGFPTAAVSPSTRLEPNRFQDWPKTRFSIGDSIIDEKRAAHKLFKRNKSGTPKSGHSHSDSLATIAASDAGDGFEKEKFFDGYLDGSFASEVVGAGAGVGGIGGMKPVKQRGLGAEDVGVVLFEGRFKVNEGSSWMGWMWPTKHMSLTTKMLVLGKSGKESKQKSATKIPINAITSVSRVDIKPYCLAVEINMSKIPGQHQSALCQKTKTLMIAFDGDSDLYDWYDTIYTRISSSGQGIDDDDHGVGRPKNFVHRVHVGFDPYTGQYSGLPDQWKRLLRGTQLGTMIDASDRVSRNPSSMLKSPKSFSHLPRSNSTASDSEFIRTGSRSNHVRAPSHGHSHSQSQGQGHSRSQSGHQQHHSSTANALALHHLSVASNTGFDYDRYGISSPISEEVEVEVEAEYVSPAASAYTYGHGHGHYQEEHGHRQVRDWDRDREREEYTMEQRRRRVLSRMDTLPSFSSTTSTVVG